MECKTEDASVLETTKELIHRSQHVGWPDEQPIDIANELEQVISALLDPKSVELPKFYRGLFAPTGPVQEIAISNEWHDAYLALSSEYDSLEPVLASE